MRWRFDGESCGACGDKPAPKGSETIGVGGEGEVGEGEGEASGPGPDAAAAQKANCSSVAVTTGCSVAEVGQELFKIAKSSITVPSGSANARIAIA